MVVEEGPNIALWSPVLFKVQDQLLMFFKIGPAFKRRFLTFFTLSCFQLVNFELSFCSLIHMGIATKMFETFAYSCYC